MLPVRVTEKELIVSGSQLNEIAWHALLPSTTQSQRSVHKEHRRSEDAHQRYAQLQAPYAELGESGRRFLEALLRTQRYAKDQAARMLALLGTYARADLIAALERAVRYGAYSHAAVERILSAQARPKTILETLAKEEWRQTPPWLGEDLISPRPTSEYQYLCESEPHDHDTPDIAEATSGPEQAASKDGAGADNSHLIQAIGRFACVLDYRVRYETSATILQELTAALADRTLARRLRYYGRFDLVILDEFGFDRLERIESPEAASLLYKLINARNGRSTALVTNIDFEAWGEYLGDPPLAMAFLDRIVDGAIVMKLKGKSYRAHRAEQTSIGRSATK